MAVSGQLHTQSALTPCKEHLVPNEEEAGRPKSQSRCYGEEQNHSPIRNDCDHVIPAPQVWLYSTKQYDD
jgi:hypothetical protein